MPQRNPRKIVLTAVICIIAAASACSIPNLEGDQCIAARDTIREFYSFHIGNDMAPSPENLKLRERFLTPQLVKELAGQTAGQRDYFTASEQYPRAFSDGGCTSGSTDSAVFNVLLFWKDDQISEQRIVKVETVLQDGKWLINKVSSE